MTKILLRSHFSGHHTLINPMKTHCFNDCKNLYLRIISHIHNTILRIKLSKLHFIHIKQKSTGVKRVLGYWQITYTIMMSFYYDYDILHLRYPRIVVLILLLIHNCSHFFMDQGSNFCRNLSLGGTYATLSVEYVDKRSYDDNFALKSHRI